MVAPDKDHKPRYTERLNGPIQSTAGDILYLTLEKLAADPRPGTHFLLSVHDKLVLECPEKDAREVAMWLKEKMRENPKVMRCQKCQKPSKHPFVTFGTPSVRVLEKYTPSSVLHNYARGSFFIPPPCTR